MEHYLYNLTKVVGRLLRLPLWPLYSCLSGDTLSFPANQLASSCAGSWPVASVGRTHSGTLPALPSVELLGALGDRCEVVIPQPTFAVWRAASPPLPSSWCVPYGSLLNTVGNLKSRSRLVCSARERTRTPWWLTKSHSPGLHGAGTQSVVEPVSP